MMKAEKTRFLLSELVKCGRLNADSLFLSKVIEELDEIERLAKVGREVEWGKEIET